MHVVTRHGQQILSLLQRDKNITTIQSEEHPHIATLEIMLLFCKNSHGNTDGANYLKMHRKNMC